MKFVLRFGNDEELLMTTEQQNLLRLQSWDNYVAAKNKYHACRAQLEQWGKTLQSLGGRLVGRPIEVIGSEFSAVPDRQSFLKGIEDFHTAGTEFKRAWIAARDFGFPVGQHDLNELGGA